MAVTFFSDTERVSHAVVAVINRQLIELEPSNALRMIMTHKPQVIMVTTITDKNRVWTKWMDKSRMFRAILDSMIAGTASSVGGTSHPFPCINNLVGAAGREFMTLFSMSLAKLGLPFYVLLGLF
jgi:hypothetical protein